MTRLRQTDQQQAANNEAYGRAHTKDGNRHCLTKPCPWHPGETHISPLLQYSAALVLADGCVDKHTPGSNPRCEKTPAGGTTPGGLAPSPVETELPLTPPAGSVLRDGGELCAEPWCAHEMPHGHKSGSVFLPLLDSLPEQGFHDDGCGHWCESGEPCLCTLAIVENECAVIGCDRESTVLSPADDDYFCAEHDPNGAERGEPVSLTAEQALTQITMLVGWERPPRFVNSSLQYLNTPLSMPIEQRLAEKIIAIIEQVDGDNAGRTAMCPPCAHRQHHACVGAAVDNDDHPTLVCECAVKHHEDGARKS